MEPRNPAYDVVAQSSKFIPAGSVRIGSTQAEGFGSVAYLRTDGARVLLIQNQVDAAREVVVSEGAESVAFSLAPGEVGTLVWPR